MGLGKPNHVGSTAGQVRWSSATCRRHVGRLVFLVAFTGLALPVSAPGAGAAQPVDTGNAHLTIVPRGEVVPRDGQSTPAQPHGDEWIPLFCLAGLLVAVPAGYFGYVRARRETA
ncbi:hypothetical protein ATK30_5270 [Amycolatopsis echigonensis]|uniref:Uncharacterized protein n=1 Tax=Amycolatopsis echigonensis TaxID=2576905 RepID=A0A2N3WKK0_9PSEU|nr:hypothetical protein ATK30_5270 [Amycolatopsis niigatensis]